MHGDATATSPPKATNTSSQCSCSCKVLQGKSIDQKPPLPLLQVADGLQSMRYNRCLRTETFRKPYSWPCLALGQKTQIKKKSARRAIPQPVPAPAFPLKETASDTGGTAPTFGTLQDNINELCLCYQTVRALQIQPGRLGS